MSKEIPNLRQRLEAARDGIKALLDRKYLDLSVTQGLSDAYQNIEAALSSFDSGDQVGISLGSLPEAIETNASSLPKQLPMPEAVRFTPEFLEWARQQFTEEEIVAALRDFEVTGGLELKDFIHELEEIAA